jgi:phage-related baseplate assembly protein
VSDTAQADVLASALFTLLLKPYDEKIRARAQKALDDYRRERQETGQTIAMSAVQIKKVGDETRDDSRTQMVPAVRR